MSHEFYENPLITRYASRHMAAIWGDQKKFSTWRRLWVALAEAEAELGINIAEAQLDELRAKLVGLLGTPATRVAQVLQAPAGQLARVVNAYSQKGEAA